MIGVSVAAWLMCLDGSVSSLEGLLLFAAAIVYTALQVMLGRRQRWSAAAAGPVQRPGGNRLADVALVLGGLGMLLLGSRWLVSGAVAIARGMGVSELVIGLTIVAAGTSLPEVATSILAAVRGQRDIAVGNVVGSNIFNLLSVLGLSAAVAPAGIGVSAAALDFDLPVMIAVSVACLPIVFTGHVIARWEGGLFLAYYCIYTAYLVLAAQQHDAIHTFRLALVCAVLPLTAVTIVVLAARELRAHWRRG
jgi:cation:H+ antiporter